MIEVNLIDRITFLFNMPFGPDNQGAHDRDRSSLRKRTHWSRSPLLFIPCIGLLVWLIFFSAPTAPEIPSLQIAVASNFQSTAATLAKHFEKETGIKVSLSPGSTGKHFAQIVSGAPYDLFLAADAKRPTRLEELGHGVANTRAVYAVGRLVLVSPGENQFETPWQRLKAGEFSHLAISNPRLAPYGRAAREVILHLQLDGLPPNKLVMGENVSQAWHFVKSGHAALGFVARSQAVSETGEFIETRESVLVPEDWHSPIKQEVILLRDREEGRAFLRFLNSDEAGILIKKAGYQVSGAPSKAPAKSGTAKP